MKDHFTKIILKLSLSLLILGGIIFVLGLEISLLSRKTNEVVSQAEAIREQENSQQNLQQDAEVARAALPILEKALPSPENLINFIADLENLASVTGNTQELNFTQETTSGNTEGLEATAQQKKTKEGGIEFTITLQGSFSSLQAYLSGVEDLPYIIEMKKIASNGNDLNTPSKTTISAILYTANNSQ